MTTKTRLININHMNQLPLPSVNLRFLKSCLNYIDGVRKTLYLDNIGTTIYAFG